MAMSKYLEQGSLVWAKIKGFPPWPGEISNTEQRRPKSKNSYCITFFGLHDYAWVRDKCIFPHTEEMLEKAKTKKCVKLKVAIQELEAKLHAKEGPKRIKSNTEDQTAIRKLKRKRTSKKDEEPPSSPAPLSLPTPLSLPKPINPPTNFEKKHNPKKHKKVEAEVSSPSPLEYFHPKKKIYNYIDKTKTVISQNHLLQKKIGFLGLERIDFRLIIKLINAGYSITIWDTGFMQKKHTYVKKAGGNAAVTPAEVMHTCDMIFCCVSNTNIKNVVFGKFGVIAGLDRCSNKAYIQLTAIDPVTAVEIGAAITRNGGRYLEAPMIDMMHGINISVISAGDRGVFNDCYTVFGFWDKRLFYMGKLFGAPNHINLCLNKKTLNQLADKLANRCDCIIDPADIMVMLRPRSASSSYLLLNSFKNSRSN